MDDAKEELMFVENDDDDEQDAVSLPLDESRLIYLEPFLSLASA